MLRHAKRCMRSSSAQRWSDHIALHHTLSDYIASELWNRRYDRFLRHAKRCWGTRSDAWSDAIAFVMLDSAIRSLLWCQIQRSDRLYAFRYVFWHKLERLYRSWSAWATIAWFAEFANLIQSRSRSDRIADHLWQNIMCIKNTHEQKRKIFIVNFNLLSLVSFC